MKKSEPTPDEKLIEEAYEMHYIDWPEIDGLIEKASSAETKEKLRSIQVSKYHREEYSCGCL